MTRRYRLDAAATLSVQCGSGRHQGCEDVGHDDRCSCGCHIIPWPFPCAETADDDGIIRLACLEPA